MFSRVRGSQTVMESVCIAIICIFCMIFFVSLLKYILSLIHYYCRNKRQYTKSRVMTNAMNVFFLCCIYGLYYYYYYYLNRLLELYDDYLFKNTYLSDYMSNQFYFFKKFLRKQLHIN